MGKTKMARDEAPREDLLAEAVALVPRVEFWSGDGPACVVGLRPAGGGSCYLGDDPAYHFNRAGELRRAFVGGRLLVARSGRLTALKRSRTPDATTLLGRELTDAQTADVLAELQTRLSALRAALAAGTARPVRCMPDVPSSVAAVRAWLDALPLPPPIAARPHAR